MNPIRRLERTVVDQIAAGEVVERPASVVKELLENALDSGAERVEVLLEEGGRRRIEVRDDGSGIPAAELELAVASHATSKLGATSDLESVATLGFRGEALASIAAVSRLEIVSRPRDAGHGAVIRVDHGAASPVREAAGPPGTRVVVEDLFAGLPARRKFLRTASTELSRCAAWVERLALSHGGTGFRLLHGGRQLFAVSAADGLAARCAAVFGSGLAGRMIAVEETGEAIRLEARIGPPETARRDASRVHLFLNGRWVREPALLRAVRQGLGEYLPSGQYPALYLALALPPERVDVNVHPQKTEVRFRDSRLVVGTVIRALQRGLARSPWATRSAGPVGREAGAAAGSSAAPRPGGGFPAPAGRWERPLPPETVVAEGASVPARGRRDEPLAVGAFLSVHSTYLVREVEGGLEIIDQHALHERVNLEELRREIRKGRVVSQPLLAPALVEVSRQEAALLEEKAPALAELGVVVEPFGDTTVAIRAVPARLTRLQPEALVRDLLEVARERRAATPDALQEEMLRSMACRGAVMAGDALDAEALRDLIRRGAGLPQDRTCAHGRPVRVFLSLADLEKAFYRR